MIFVKRILNILSNILCTILLIGIIATAVCFALGIKPYVVLSGSMEPNIHTGSVCFVNSKASYDEVEVGDVIAFKTTTGVMVTHRVIEETAEGFVTQGDANDVPDGIITTRSNFGGETIFSVPQIGYAMVALQKPANIAIVIVIILAILALSFVDTMEEGVKKKK